MRIIHLSDPHVLCDYARLPLRETGWRGVIPRLELTGLRRAPRFTRSGEQLRALVAQIQRLDADQVVVSGDLSAIGASDELEQARALLAPLEDRLTVIPGNHDRYGPDDEHHRRFERAFAPLLRSDLPGYALPCGYPFVRLVGERLALIGLDSTRVPSALHYFMGQVGLAQLSALDRLLDDPHLRGRKVLLLVHHAPLSARGLADRHSAGLWDTALLLRTVRRRVHGIHFGHVHQRYWHPATVERGALFGAGSATERGGEGFLSVEYREGEQHLAEAVAPLAAA